MVKSKCSHQMSKEGEGGGRGAKDTKRSIQSVTDDDTF